MGNQKISLNEKYTVLQKKMLLSTCFKYFCTLKIMRIIYTELYQDLNVNFYREICL